MKRRAFLGLLGLAGCTDINEDCMNVGKKLWWMGSSSNGGPIDPETTTPDGKQAFLAIGDSNIAGSGFDSIGPTTAADTLYHWNGTDIDEITTTDISNTNPAYGTIFKKFATDYKAATTRKPVIINEGLGGSYFFNSNAAISWDPTGDLYPAAVTEANDCLSFLGLTELKGIILVCGTNDARAGFTIGTILSAMQDLITSLQIDFPGVPIYISQLGAIDAGVVMFDTKLNSIRIKLRELVRDTTSCYFFTSFASFWRSGVANDYYNADQLHLYQAGYNIVGSQLSRCINLTATYSKEATGVIASLIDDISTTRKNLIAAFVDSQVTAGNYYLFNTLQLFKTTTINNIYVDWAMVGVSLDTPALAGTFNANSDFQFNGSSDAFGMGWHNSDGIATQNDIIFGAKVKTNNTATGTLSTLIGKQLSSGQPISIIRQNASGNISFFVHDQTQTFATGSNTVLNNDTLYSAYRSGTTKGLYINKTLNTSATVASTGDIPTLYYLGCFFFNGAGAQWFNGNVEYAFTAKFTGFNIDSFYDNSETLIDNW